MADERTPPSLRQLRVTDGNGNHFSSIGQYPSKYLPPSHYAVPESFYAGAPVNIGLQPDEMAIFGSILQGGIGAEHAPTRQQLLIQSLLDYKNRLRANPR